MGKIKIILILGIIVRVILGAITYHSDIAPIPFAGRVMADGNLSNFYDYLWQLPGDHEILRTYPRNLFNYPPAVYFGLGGVSLISSSPVSASFVQKFILDFTSTLGDIRLNILLLLLKLPYLFFDLACAFLLMKFFTSERDKTLAFALWIFNPINLYATYMMGMYEIIPTFFVIASLYVVRKNPTRFATAALLLGLGAAFKIFPLLFLAPLASLTTNWKDRFKVVAVGVGVYLLSILPFVSSRGFRTTALLAGQTTKSFYLALPISGGEAILPFLALVIFFYILFLMKKTSVENLWRRYFVVLLLFFSLTHYHPQWFLWITPFFIFDLIHSNFKHWPPLALTTFSFFGLLTFFDPGLTVGIFSPIAPNLYRAQGIWETLKITVDLNFARSLLQTIFVGSALYWFYFYLSPAKNED